MSSVASAVKRALRGYPFVANFLFPSITLEQILEVEFHLGRFFNTSPSSFAEYDFKSFMWQYDKMIEHEKKENNPNNRQEITNPNFM